MEINEYQLEYKINKNERKIRILGGDFVYKNRNKCKIVINNKRLDLLEFLEVDNISKLIKENKFKIRLLIIKEINDLSKMFYDCKLLSKIEIVQKKNINNENIIGNNPFINNDKIYVEDISSKFSNCESLETLPDFSEFDTTKIKSFYNLFSDC